MSLMQVFQVGASATVAQSQRLNAIASNIANAETTSSADGEGYRARHVLFRPTPGPGGVAVGVEVAAVVDSPAPFKRHYQPGHPHADAQGYVQASNVDPVEEMVNMISASRSYQNNVEVMNTAKTLLLKTLQMGQ